MRGKMEEKETTQWDFTLWVCLAFARPGRQLFLEHILQVRREHVLLFNVSLGLGLASLVAVFRASRGRRRVVNWSQLQCDAVSVLYDRRVKAYACEERSSQSRMSSRPCPEP